MTLDELYQKAVSHRTQHGCSAYPYEDYPKLFEIVAKHQPRQILEIGTGMGFTSVVMALASPAARIDTLEKDFAHMETAQEFIASHQLSERITVHNVVAEEYLSTLNQQYDLIFFDGYQIHYEFIPHYEKLLKSGGVLILGNNQLTSKTSDQFFEQLHNQNSWVIIGKFADTTIAVKI